MIAVALLVLPVVVMEIGWEEFVAANVGWQATLQVTAAFIWAAFTFEFTVMVSVVRHKWSYTWRHWIDVLIILLPMVTFLRAARLTQLLRMNQLSRTIRLYRLRGVSMKLWRALVAAEIVEMLLSLNPERRMERLEHRLEEKLAEIEYLKRDMERLQKRIEARRAKKAARASGDSQPCDSHATEASRSATPQEGSMAKEGSRA
jgi:voltage-gated potassium channel